MIVIEKERLEKIAERAIRFKKSNPKLSTTNAVWKAMDSLDIKNYRPEVHYAAMAALRGARVVRSAAVPEEELRQGYLLLRERAKEFVRSNRGQSLTDAELFKLIGQTIASTWGSVECLPEGQWAYLRDQLLKMYSGPRQISLGLNELHAADRTTIGPKQPMTTVREKKLAKIEGKARELHLLLGGSDDAEVWRLAINAAIKKFSRRFKIKPERQFDIFREVASRIGLCDSSSVPQGPS